MTASSPDWIVIQGAREHNLKDVTVRFPRNQLSVVSGVSGSGKSTLLLNILVQEGERKFVSASGHAADNVQRPDYDNIYGLSPIISVSQHHHNFSRRSTVGTYSEIYTYLRLLYTAIGERACPHCHTIFNYADIRTSPVRMSEENHMHQEQYACPSCGQPVENITMAHFSFNSQLGACPTCTGLGEQVEPILDAIVRPDLSIHDGGIQVWKKGFLWHFAPLLLRAAKYYRLPLLEEDLQRPIGELPDIVRHMLLYGTDDQRIRALRPDAPAPSNMKQGKYEGAVNSLLRRYYEGDDDEESQQEFTRFLRTVPCGSCHGSRLNPASLHVQVHNTPIHHLMSMSLTQLLNWLEDLPSTLPERYIEAAHPIWIELLERTQSLMNTGMDYLTLDRSFSSLSGGEAQRMRLSSLLNSSLSGMICVLDEPTAGLHPQDTDKLMRSIRKLTDLGNTVIVIEHDIDVIRQADYVVDIGPGAGELGGNLMFQGKVNELMQHPESMTARSLRGSLETNQSTARSWHRVLTIRDAHSNNLQHITVDIPLGILTVIAGVSGSGKSTLVLEELLPRIQSCRLTSSKSDRISGHEHIQHLVVVDQQAMGKISRSNAATYTKGFDEIREWFKELASRQGLRLKASDFSFNVAGGRCETCKGTGSIKVQMHFMADRFIACPTCQGKRYHEKILSVQWRGHSIADVLQLSIEQARELFRDNLKIAAKLNCLCDIGLGYLRLGQPSSTFSGGEAQRVKLAAELSNARSGHTLYILDEPSVGLHNQDTSKLLAVLNRLVDRGDSVLLIEHHTQLIANADWVIELGPGGGQAGGSVIAFGTPDELRTCKESIIGAYL
ncbi:excinuclease ABC subunit UvrA [Paenibacillus alvei]|uniref:excinuclease ABC subunit UvrA n=1 Tax=Paenibacillus alvei TaxID=44250 RepID=UPI0018CE0549|nr:excinuclease ABC subunit UvrA [Paenibacillus alvei]MBG9736946.1 excinuclease ABC subunit A [Paenibacillus alvei]MBG9746468.1 excinuclease ABC subunit A [Paenibacillus alvei]MCY9579197.1 excinuclease ABC subunit UvrA [Paenibacillus alvei]MCY9583653.1 excinuclease ABC subunit UvrA [Paenibacillus alvei]